MRAANPLASVSRVHSTSLNFMHLARVHALQASANAAIAIALADSLFFSIDPTAARSQIILYLLLTMLPFLLVAPLVGPAIDKLSRGPKVIMLLFMALSVLAALGMIGRTQTLLVFPMAFAVLVSNKGYVINKAAILPLISESTDQLVARNSQLAVLAGVMSFIGAIPAGLSSLLLGSSVAVALAVIQFALATLVTFQLRLPSRSEMDGVDDADATGATPGDATPAGETFTGAAQDFSSFIRDMRSNQPAGDPNFAADGDFSSVHPDPSASSVSTQSRSKLHYAVAPVKLWQRSMQNPSMKLPSIISAALVMSVLRGCLGFMTFFLAFHFRGGTDSVDLSGVGTALGAGVSNVLGFSVDSQGVEPIWKLGLLVGFAVAGGLAGSFLAPRLRQTTGDRVRNTSGEWSLMLGCLGLVLLGCLIAWFVGGFGGGILVAFSLGFAGGAGKVAFDSIVQSDASQDDYGRSFAIYETRFQLVWVLGALIPVLFTIPFELGCWLLIATAIGAAVLSFVKRRQQSKATAPAAG